MFELLVMCLEGQSCMDEDQPVKPRAQLRPEHQRQPNFGLPVSHVVASSQAFGERVRRAIAPSTRCTK